jgi:hypothetical protein
MTIAKIRSSDAGLTLRDVYAALVIAVAFVAVGFCIERRFDITAANNLR